MRNILDEIAGIRGFYKAVYLLCMELPHCNGALSTGLTAPQYQDGNPARGNRADRHRAQGDVANWYTVCGGLPCRVAYIWTLNDSSRQVDDIARLAWGASPLD
jgi:hypothetical protein